MSENAPGRRQMSPEEQAAYDLAKAKGIAAGYLVGLSDTIDKWKGAEHRATHDSLTGLLNKEAFHDALNERVEEAKEANRSLGVFFIDLKDFKQVNDKLGHRKGDEIIIRAANLVRDTVRSEESEHPDVVAKYGNSEPGRLGGDEIGVIFDLSPGTRNRDTDLTTEERLEAAKNRIMSNFDADEEITSTGVGISIGGAILKPDESAEELLDRADKEMYEHKQSQKDENGSYR